MKTGFIKKYFIIISLLFLPVFCNAQLQNTQIKIIPEFPEANSDVSLSIESYSTDLNRSEISWYKNGTLAQRSVGEKSFTFKTRGLGSSDTISVRVDGVLVDTITITPAEVDLIWEVNTYTPPFYKGKALNSNQSTLKIVAVPHIISSSGSKFSPNNLIYTWKKDWKVLGNNSGYGRDVLTFEGEVFNGTIITVEARTTGGSIVAQKRIILNNQDSKIVFYEDDPLLGVLYENALEGVFNLEKDEINIKAVPLFLSNEEINTDNLKYNWVMNSKRLTDLENQTSLVLRKGEQGGTTQLSLEISNLRRVMQFTRSSLGISFESTENTNIFGF